MTGSVSSKNSYNVSPIHSGFHDPLLQAMDANDVDEVVRLLKDGNIDQPLSNGEMPFVYAIRTGKENLVRTLVQEFPNVDVMTQKDSKHHLTLFEHAVIAKNSEILTAVLLIAYSQNAVNDRDLADPSRIEKIAKEALQKDPLKISFLDWTFFAGILSSWILNYYGKTPTLYACAQVATVVTSFLKWRTILQNMKTWKGRLLWTAPHLAEIGLFLTMILEGGRYGNPHPILIKSFLGLGAALSILNACLVAKGSFTQLSAAWKNRSLEPSRSLRSAVVHSVIGLDSCRPFVDVAKTAHKVAKATLYSNPTCPIPPPSSSKNDGQQSTQLALYRPEQQRRPERQRMVHFVTPPELLVANGRFVGKPATSSF